MQLKEQSLEQFYKEYLEQYSTARRGGATPTNMHPEDTPTIVFIVDTLIQLCSLPVRKWQLFLAACLCCASLWLHASAVPLSMAAEGERAGCSLLSSVDETPLHLLPIPSQPARHGNQATSHKGELLSVML